MPRNWNGKVPVARYSACEIAWVQMGLTSVSVCGAVPVAAVDSAGIVTLRIPTGTIGTIEGPLL